MKIGDLVSYEGLTGLITRETTVEEQPIPALWNEIDGRTPLYYVVWSNGMEFCVRPTEEVIEVISASR
jgi:hypothetical protein